MNFHYELFKNDFPNNADTLNGVDVRIENEIIRCKNRENSSELIIDCHDDDKVRYKGTLIIPIKDIKFVDFEKNIYDIGILPDCFKFMQYFDLVCNIIIEKSGQYVVYIGGFEDNPDGVALSRGTPIERYFKNIDIYMTDINLRRSNMINSEAKLKWYVNALNYIQRASKNNYTYFFSINDMMVTTKLNNYIKAIFAGDVCSNVESIEFNNVEFETEDDKNNFAKLFRGAKFVGI